MRKSVILIYERVDPVRPEMRKTQLPIRDRVSTTDDDKIENEELGKKISMCDYHMFTLKELKQFENIEDSGFIFSKETDYLKKNKDELLIRNTNNNMDAASIKQIENDIKQIENDIILLTDQLNQERNNTNLPADELKKVIINSVTDQLENYKKQLNEKKLNKSANLEQIKNLNYEIALQENVNTEMSKKHLEIVNVKDDGNCFFYSILASVFYANNENLNDIFENESGSSMRVKSCNELLSNTNKYVSQFNNINGLQKLASDFNNNKVYVEHSLFEPFCNTFKVQLYIIFSSNISEIMPKKYGNKNDPLIQIAMTKSNHYDGVRKKVIKIENSNTKDDANLAAAINLSQYPYDSISTVESIPFEYPLFSFTNSVNYCYANSVVNALSGSKAICAIASGYLKNVFNLLNSSGNANQKLRVLDLRREIPINKITYSKNYKIDEFVFNKRKSEFSSYKMSDSISFNEFIISIYPLVYELFFFKLNSTIEEFFNEAQTKTYLGVKIEHMKDFYKILSFKHDVPFFNQTPKIFLVKINLTIRNFHELVVIMPSFKIDNDTYNLISIVCHTHNIHFVAYVKKNATWWKYNDSQVEKKDLSTLGLSELISNEVIHIYNTCSLLYYERQDN